MADKNLTVTVLQRFDVCIKTNECWPCKVLPHNHHRLLCHKMVRVRSFILLPTISEKRCFITLFVFAFFSPTERIPPGGETETILNGLSKTGGHKK
jgi:hypothetical protein